MDEDADIRRLLPLRELERALGAVTERLALELSPPPPAPPAWSELEWTLAPAVAAMHGVAPLLASLSLRDRPNEWRAFLEHQRIMTSARQRRIGALLDELDGRARRAGIALMPLKGAALNALGLYAGGERPMADLDLLVSAR
ncbi:MAG: nucleotidyltransferase family protein, partial [Steroidobacteraceae bacterium]